MEKTLLDKPSFLLGYIYRIAQECKREGHFEGWSDKEIINYFIDSIKENKHESNSRNY